MLGFGGVCEMGGNVWVVFIYVNDGEGMDGGFGVEARVAKVP